MELKIFNEENVKNSDDSQLFLSLCENDNNREIGLIIVNNKGEKITKGNLLVYLQYSKLFVLLPGVSEIVPCLKDPMDETILIGRQGDDRTMRYLAEKFSDYLEEKEKLEKEKHKPKSN